MSTVPCPTCGNAVEPGSACVVDGTVVGLPLATEGMTVVPFQPAPSKVPPKPKAKDPDGWVSIGDDLEHEEKQPSFAPAPHETKRTKKGR